MAKTGEEQKYNAVKAGFWYTASNLLIKGMPFFTLPIFLRLMTVEEFGIYNTYLSYEGLLGIILALGLQGTIKTAKFHFKETFHEYVSNLLWIVFLMFGVVTAAINIVLLIFGNPTMFSNQLVNILMLNSVGTAILSIMTCKYIIEGNYLRNMGISFFITFINISLSLILCYTTFKAERHMARILGNTISTVLIAGIVCVWQLKGKRNKVNKSHLSYGLKMGLPLLPHLLSVIFMAQSDKIMIQSMVGNAEAGVYSLAVNIMSILVVILNSFDNAWAPWYYGGLAKNDFKNLKEKNNRLVGFFMLFTIAFMLVTPDVIRIMSTDDYGDAVLIVIPLIISVFLNFIYLFPVNLEYFYKKTFYISFSTVITAGINLVLNYFGILMFGYIAAAFATMISKGVLALLHWRRANSICKEPVVGLKPLLSSVAVVLMAGFICFLTRDTYIVRYSIVLGCGILLLVNFKKYKN